MPKSGGGVLQLQQTHTYDARNRLLRTSEVAVGETGGSWQVENGYDAWGNRWVNAAQTTLSVQAATPLGSSWIDGISRPRSNGPLDRPIRALKHALVEIIDIMSGDNPTQAALDLMWFLRPRTGEEYNGGLGYDSVQAVMLPFAVVDLARLIRLHSFVKHIVVQGEFPGVRTKKQLEDVVQRILLDPKSEIKTLSGGRIAYWHEETSSVTIINTKTPDKSTIFQPGTSKTYFDNLK